jgi:hypothetical protein
MLFQKVFVQIVAIVGLVADEFFRSSLRKHLPRTISTSFTSWGEALARQTATGKPEASTMAMIRLPLPRFVQPTAAPPHQYSPIVGTSCGTFGTANTDQVNLSTAHQSTKSIKFRSELRAGHAASALSDPF